MKVNKAQAFCKIIESCYRKFKINVRIQPYRTISSDEMIFEVWPLDGTKVKKIFDLSEDVKVRLFLQEFNIFKVGTHIYIRACSSYIKHNQLLPMLNFISPEKPNPHLQIALGYDMMRNMVFDNLDEMPHLLITGSSNSGKSVSLKCLILSLTYKLPAQYVNLVIFDVGGNSLLGFEGLPHLSYPIVQEIDECQYVIEEVRSEMERRLTLDEREINVLPEIVCIIDEFVSVSGRCTDKFAVAISEILRRGRKVKIHMVLAAQSSTKGALGIEDNNITARIAFQCANCYDSISAINRAGAEKLTGKGDMLYKPYNSTELEHLQGAYISDSDCAGMINEIKEGRHILDHKYVIPHANPITLSIMKDDPELGSRTDNNANQELVDIIMWVLGRNEVSVNGLKEKFQMGNRANNFIDKLCEFGIVSEKFAKKPRTVVPQSVEDLSEDIKDLLNNGGITDEQIQTVFENRT